MARTSNSLPAFLLALRDSIVQANVNPSPTCQVVTEERTLEYIAGQYTVMCIVGNLVPEDQGGAGQAETIFRGRIKFRMLSQTALDPATSDVVALTDTNTTTGIYVLFTALLQVIRFWDLCDSAGNCYLAEPMRLASGVAQPRRHEQHKEYVFSDVEAEFKICIATGGSGN